MGDGSSEEKHHLAVRLSSCRLLAKLLSPHCRHTLQRVSEREIILEGSDLMALDPTQQCSVCPSLSIKRLGVVKRLKRDGDGKGRGNMAFA